MSIQGSAQNAGQEEILVKNEVREPARYRVLLHNDDYTSMDFVVNILCTVFNKTIEDATTIMLTIHNHGIGECGVYTKEIAEAKVGRVHHDARVAGFPLKCSMEKV